MRQVSAALRAAIESGERVVKNIITVDWDNDGIQDIDDLTFKVDSLGVTQSLESSIPQPVQVVPGVAVAELTTQLFRGNTFRYTVPANYRGFTSVTANSGSGTFTIQRPTGAQTGDVILLAVFIASNDTLNETFSTWDPLRQANVGWSVLSVRGDGLAFSSPAYARVEGLLMQRRVADGEPANYTIVLPQGLTFVYAAYAVNIGEANIMGITDVQTKGEDETDTVTSITIPPVTVDVPNSTIVSFYAASSWAVTGVGFTTIDTSDVERSEISTTAAGTPNVRAALVTTSDVAQGRYLKSVNVTSAPPISATLGFAVVLAPKLAGDEAQHAAWTFSELNPNGPYAGKMRVRRLTAWDIAFMTDNGFESVPIFRGYTTAPSASASRAAVIKALDNREDMRNTQQGTAVFAKSLESRDIFFGGLPAYPGLESTWMISNLFAYAFRQFSNSTTGIFTYQSQPPYTSGEGFFAAPPARLRWTELWVPMHGSAEPFVGSLIYAYREGVDTALRDVLRFDVGPFVACTRREPESITQNAAWQTNGAYATIDDVTGQMEGRVEFYALRNLTNSTIQFITRNDQPNTHRVTVEMTNTGVFRVVIHTPSADRTVVGPTVPLDGAWHYLGVHFNTVAGSATFNIDGTTSVVAFSTFSNSAPSVVFSIVTMTLTNQAQVSDIVMAGTYRDGVKRGVQVTDPWIRDGWTPSAFIDKSENILDCIPTIDDQQDTWSVVTDIASAEFAAVYFDADGFPHFRTSRSDVTPTGQTVQKQITSRKTLKDIEYTSGVAQIRNITSVGYTPFVTFLDQEFFRISGIVSILPGRSLDYTIVLAGPVIQQGVVNVTGNSQPDGLGDELFVGWSLQVVGMSSIALSVINENLQPVYLVDNTGQPAFSATATWMEAINTDIAPVTYHDIDSIRKYGEQPLPTIDASPWRQHEDSAAMLALKLLSDLSEAHPVITRLSIKGDPTLEFGDLTTIIDPNGLGVNGNYRITGKDPSMSVSDGFTQSLVVREAPAVAFWDTNFWDDGTVWG